MKRMLSVLVLALLITAVSAAEEAATPTDLMPLEAQAAAVVECEASADVQEDEEGEAPFHCEISVKTEWQEDTVTLTAEFSNASGPFAAAWEKREAAEEEWHPAAAGSILAIDTAGLETSLEVRAVATGEDELTVTSETIRLQKKADQVPAEAEETEEAPETDTPETGADEPDEMEGTDSEAVLAEPELEEAEPDTHEDADDIPDEQNGETDGEPAEEPAAPEAEPEDEPQEDADDLRDEQEEDDLTEMPAKPEEESELELEECEDDTPDGQDEESDGEPEDMEELVELDDYEVPLALSSFVPTTVLGEAALRQEADGLSPVVRTLSDGENVTAVEDCGDWVKVVCGEAIGYLYREQVAAYAGGELSENRSVQVFTSRSQVVAKGETIMLTSLLQGFEGCGVQYQWECDKGEGFAAVEGANEETYSYQASAESLRWNWRLTVTY